MISVQDVVVTAVVITNVAFFVVIIVILYLGQAGGKPGTLHSTHAGGPLLNLAHFAPQFSHFYFYTNENSRTTIKTNK